MRTLLFPLFLVVLMGSLVSGCDNFGSSSDSEEGSTTFPPPEAVAQSFPRWSPDGNRILYYDHGVLRHDPETGWARHDQSRKGLWVMRPDGTERQQVLAGSSLYGDWSPDGDSLVFEAGAQIYKAAFEGGVVDTSSVVQLSPPGRFFDPDWSPSGRQVAYRNSIGDTTGIWISPTDGSRSKDYFVQGSTPQWFPSGQRLLYACNGLCMKQIDHFSQQKIFSFPENDDSPKFRGGAVSPSGDRVVMGATISSQIQIRTMNADGSNQRTLTTIEDRWWSAGQPDWSPDGERIVYIGPEHTIWVMDADGSNKEQLTTRPEGPVGREESS